MAITARNGPHGPYLTKPPAEEGKRPDTRSFEERWLATSDCCADCARVIGLRPVDRSAQPAEDEGGRNWVAIGSVIVLVPMAAGLLIRIAAVALR